MDTRTHEFINEWLANEATLFTGVGPPAAQLSEEAQTFLRDVLVEAFDWRRAEPWPQATLGLSPYERVSFDQVSKALYGELGEIVQSVILDAYQETDEPFRKSLTADVPGAEQILLIDMLVVINRRWCSIWPFCRPSNRL
jgi:hypothetical protein